MKYLNKYIDFSVLEHSKNDPIPEITNNNGRLAIVLMGTPGVGKSFFTQNYIQHKNRNIKIFSTDDVSLLYTKDPNVYKEGASEMNMKRIRVYIKSGGSFVFDTTGTHKENVEEIVKLSRENNYDVIFIHLMGTLDMSLRQNSQRNRNVDVDYLKYSYETQSKNIKYYSELRPDKYYIVYNIDGKYRFMRYNDGMLLRRKVDKYVPFKESVDNTNMFDHLKNHLLDLIDDNIEVLFKGDGDVDYVSADTTNGQINTLLNTTFVVKEGFNIKIKGEFSFEKFTDIINIMYTLDTYLSKYDWKLTNFIKSNGVGITFKDMTFTYSKPDQVVNVNSDINKIKDVIKRFLNDKGIGVDDIDIDENDINISYSIYNDGYIEYVSNRELHKYVEILVDKLGGSEYDIDGNLVEGTIVITR